MIFEFAAIGTTRVFREVAAWGSRRRSRGDAARRIRRRFGAALLTGLLAAAPGATNAIDQLTICYDKAQAHLVALAKLRNFYSGVGLEVELRAYPSGRQALEAMFANQCALSTVAETPTVHYSLERNDFLIVAIVSMSDNFERIIVRNGRGILVPADLRGHSIAVPKFTTAHYFLDTYLVAIGLSPQDVKPVFMPPQEVAAAFRRGEVDAAVHWEPDIQLLAEEFGAKVKVFATPGLHVSPFMLVGGRDYIRNNSAVVERVLRALTRAESYNKEQPANAKALVTKFYNANEREINFVWALKVHRVSLDQSLPFLLENAARWEIGLLPPARRPAVPNYLDFIYLDGLLAVSPAAVTIIH